jgi:DnaK suppressor protein
MRSKTAQTVKPKRTAAETRPAEKPAGGHAPATEQTVRTTPAPVGAPPAESPATRPAVRGTPVVATAISRGTTQPPAADTQTDAEDADEGSSLLAGPRNVKPYIAKRGEQYMNREQLEHFRQILLNWKRDLMEEVDRTVTHMKDEAANFPDPNDRATQEEEFSLELRTRDRERKLIRKIDEALKRIEDGTYGYCLETGEEIGIKRLEARPVATLSIEAQERRERRERQYGERDDRYR